MIGPQELFSPFHPGNCEGYSLDEMATLNQEFRERWYAREYAPSFLEEARKAFQEEVSRR